jgi:hypothetical protein
MIIHFDELNVGVMKLVRAAKEGIKDSTTLGEI